MTQLEHAPRGVMKEQASKARARSRRLAAVLYGVEYLIEPARSVA